MIITTIDNMNLRKFVITLVAIIVGTSMSAQKQLTIRSVETGESFEVTIPDNLKIYEYNVNWLDSIPYLLEHARNKEPWAFEALGECYRYGKGVEKSITNAMIYYDESNINTRDVVKEIYDSDPFDELGFMNHLMEELDKKRITIEEAVSLIDSYPAPLPKWAVRIKRIFENKDLDNPEGYIKSLVDVDNDSADELVASLACLKILKPDTPSITSLPPTPENMRNLTLGAKKLPILFNIAGDKYLIFLEDYPNKEQALKNAFELYHKAYLYGLLQPRGAVEILDYRDDNQLYEGFPFTKEEMKQLDSLYSKDYRVHFRSSCEIKEIGVYDENPVVLESEVNE